MALNIDALSTRWGKEFGSVNAINTFRGTTIFDRADDVNALYTAAADQRIVVDNLYDRTLGAENEMGTLAMYYEDIARRTLQKMCQDDTTSLAITDDSYGYLTKMINDMVVADDSFLYPTVTVGGSTSSEATEVNTVSGAPTGDGLMITSVVNPYTGKTLYYSYAESLRFICVSDIANSEVTIFQVSGTTPLAVSDANWPAGSGAVINVDQLPTDLGFLPNADFETWSGEGDNTPGNWAIQTFVPGTTLKKNVSFYTGLYNAQFVGAAAGCELLQDVALSTNTNYLVGIRLLRTDAATAGVITIGIVEAIGGGSYIQDAAGDDLKLTIALTGDADTDYQTYWAVLPVPQALPKTVKISLRISTSMAAAERLEVDDFIIKPLLELYTYGPQVVAYPGSINAAAGDRYVTSVANNASTLTFIRNIDRLYNARENRLEFPVSASPTISNGLIS